MATKKALVIVESPAKARTIAKYLGRDYVVKASLGHVKDLPKNELGVAVDNGFEPQFVIIPGKEKTLRELRASAKDVESIILATDPDREGEAIGWHIAQELQRLKKPIYRIWLREITRNGVRTALKDLRQIDQAKVEAQWTRRILDRLVGYEISPLLWEKIWRGLSAGRVQSVALRMIVEREREIERFVPEEYWKIRGLFVTPAGDQFWARLVRYQGKKIKLPDRATAQRMAEMVHSLSYRIEKIETKRRKQTPPAPFITAWLQQEAARRFRWPASRTMQIAQRLYEGVDLPDGRTGLITYMRTDSVRVADTAVKQVREFIARRWGKEHMSPRPRVFRSRKGAQDAHEAIRPTDVNRTPDAIRPHVSDEEYRLYQLIWNRFVASQMADAEFDTTRVVVRGGDYEFEAKGEVLVKTGFLQVYQTSAEAEASENHDDANHLPELKNGQAVNLKDLQTTQHFTQPPPRYTEASLIRALEKEGIGRPSTYATILSVIQNRDYVIKDRQVFRPTALGRLVCELLVAHFPDLMDYKYTAKMEAALDKVEERKLDRFKILEKFYKKFRSQLENASSGMPSYKGGASLGHRCPVCGSGEVILRWSRNGGFVYCSRDECTFKMDYEQYLNPERAATASYADPCPRCGATMDTQTGPHGAYAECGSCGLTLHLHPDYPVVRDDRSCPEGHAPLVLKNGPYGLYYACIKEDCRGTRPVFLDRACLNPDCDGEIVLRSFRRGKRLQTFYGCTNYPNCTFAFSGVIVDQPCPVCGAPFQVQRGRRLQCVAPGCARAVQRRRGRKKSAAAR